LIWKLVSLKVLQAMSSLGWRAGVLYTICSQAYAADDTAGVQVHDNLSVQGLLRSLGSSVSDTSYF
jgi:hypothetical protein